jgi:hypothetical protein
MMPREDTQFRPGQSGNPAGRPKGSRNRISEKFLADLCGHYDENGLEAIKAVFLADPVAYIRVIAGLLPKQTDTGEGGEPLLTALAVHFVKPPRDDDAGSIDA